ncbi:predicted protein [Lichtheimia corymbifera JMRC:FSU:9682]|uniref:Uncharacterized protein n=1 Tax=Lichtheimia corymbifera JMRC:FSU:9682 TaxID=1263082 RepID=A0A068S768_9FUNG|nr:predicted protein [Lichtheimia corymbifera JMRC:FSU:9682]
MLLPCTHCNHVIVAGHPYQASSRHLLLLSSPNAISSCHSPPQLPPPHSYPRGIKPRHSHHHRSPPLTTERRRMQGIPLRSLGIMWRMKSRLHKELYMHSECAKALTSARSMYNKC